MELPRRELKRAFALVDASVREAIKSAEISGRPCACGSNCPHCCHQLIPLTPAELLLIMNFVKKDMTEPARECLRKSLHENKTQGHAHSCPFLLKDSCAIYPVRPIACRRYLVSGRPCKAGEDAYALRRGDLIVPDPKARDDALSLLLPWHAINWRGEGVPLPDSKNTGLEWLKKISTIIQAVNWETVLKRED